MYLWFWLWRGFLRCVCHYIWRVYIISRQHGHVWNSASAIFVVHTVDLSLGWTFNGQIKATWHKTQHVFSAEGFEINAEAAWAWCVCTVHTLRRIFSVDGEHGGFIGGPVDQTRAVRRHVRTVSVVHIELQRTLWWENKWAFNTMRENIQQNRNRNDKLFVEEFM